jgi:tetratricopeptide (TPR) repeat protein
LSEEELWELLPESQGEERAFVLFALCKQSYDREAGSEALAFAEAALDIYANYGLDLEDSVYVNALMAKAQSLKLLNRVEEALEEIEKVINYHRQNGSRYLDDFLRTQSNWLGSIGNWEAAMQCQAEAVRINEIDGNHEWLAISRYRSAFCLMKLGDYNNAQAELQLARGGFKELGKISDIGECDVALANCYFELRAYEAGIAAATRSETLARVSQKYHDQARAMLILIKLHIAMGNMEKAQPLVVDVGYLANIGHEKDWELLAQVQEISSLYHRSGNFLDRAQEDEDRAATIRDILG